LETGIVSKVKKSKTINGKVIERIIGVNIEVDVVKSSIWKPYRTAPVTIIFDYGIDNVRSNLQFIKDHSKQSVYTLGEENIGKSMDDAIKYIEDNKLEKQLADEVVDLWEEIESKFDSQRKPKRQ
jgi:hypothetical protein